MWLPALTGAVLLTGAALLAQSEDPVLRFYCDRARVTCNERHPVQQGLTYSFTATSFRQQLGRKGTIKHVDSTIANYYFSEGALDSLTTTMSTSGKIKDLDFFYPNVFDLDYDYRFFPNDTGGDLLTIGFDTDSLGDPRPVGLAVIDRYDYSMSRLYLFYPEKPKYKRYSRVLYLSPHDGYVFPDSVVESGSRSGILSDDHYRLRTMISDLRISGDRP
jgi:hypothetical protein